MNSTKIQKPPLKSKIPVPSKTAISGASKDKSYNTEKSTFASKGTLQRNISISNKKSTVNHSSNITIKNSHVQSSKSCNKEEKLKVNVPLQPKNIKVVTQNKGCRKKPEVSKPNNKENEKKCVIFPDRCRKKPEVSKPNSKENEKKCVIFPDQQGIKFEPDEESRKMILSNRPITPSRLNIQNGTRFSMYDRISLYLAKQNSEDPAQRALREVKAMSERRRTEYDPKKLGFGFKLEKKFMLSPRKMTPYEKAMLTCAEIKRRNFEKCMKKTKSAKKVTFNMNVQEIDAPLEDHTCSGLPKELEARLTNISEKGEESTPRTSLTEQSPVTATTKTSECFVKTPYFKKIKEVISSEVKNNDVFPEQKAKREPLQTAPATISGDEQLPDNLLLTISSPVKKLTSVLSELCLKDCEYQGSYSEQYIKESTASNIMQSGMKKIYTPRPVSFYSQASLSDSASPDFLDRRSSKLQDIVPIYTPLVLKNLSEASPEKHDPVRLKLDFADVERCSVSRKMVPRNYERRFSNPLFKQRISDVLADQECNLLTHIENHMVCDRYLTNPIACTLDAGDDMHFIPVEFLV